jgi:hypothetical protein
MQKANQATNGQVTADAERRVTAFIQRRIDKLLCFKDTSIQEYLAVL